MVQLYRYSQGCDRKPKVGYFGRFFFVFSQPKTDFLESFFRLPKKTETEKPTRLFSVVFFSCPLRKKTSTSLHGNPVMDGHMDSFGTQQQQQRSSNSAAAAAAAA